MQDPYELVQAMLALAVAAVMLVAGAMYLDTRADAPPARSAPPSVLMSSR